MPARVYGARELRHPVIHQLIDPARQQGRKVVVIVPDPVAAGQHGKGRPRPAGQIETAALDLFGQPHLTALLGKPMQENDDIDCGGG